MSDERIITAATVTSGDKGDGSQLEEPVNQKPANGMGVDTVVGDTAYYGKNDIISANDDQNGFEPVARFYQLTIHRLSEKICTFYSWLFDFWRNQNNQNGLTPPNGISHNFFTAQKFLADSNR